MLTATDHFDFNQTNNFVDPQDSGQDTFAPSDTLYGGKGHDHMQYGRGSDTVYFGETATYDPDAGNRLADEYRIDDSNTCLDPSFFG